VSLWWDEETFDKLMQAKKELDEEYLDMEQRIEKVARGTLAHAIVELTQTKSAIVWMKEHGAPPEYTSAVTKVCDHFTNAIRAKETAESISRGYQHRWERLLASIDRQQKR
jgi:hypothetical protein